MRNTIPISESIEIVALRQMAIYVPTPPEKKYSIKASTVHCLQQLRSFGFTLTEDALHALNAISAKEQGIILKAISEALGLALNWNPLVKGWLEPTGEDITDHLATAFANFLESAGYIVQGTTLPCGHLIPNGTFDLERYNGCPFCGMPFRISDEIYYGQGSHLKTLKLWTMADVDKFMAQTIASSTPLDSTQTDSLKRLLDCGAEIPEGAEVPVRETAIMLIDALIERGQGERASFLFKTPNDVLRYLWMRHTGHKQIVPPKAAQRIAFYNFSNRLRFNSYAGKIRAKAVKEELKLSYSRAECRMAAKWLNAIPMPAPVACANMHPKRGMWTRFIRALRLAEYSRKPGYERLGEMLRLWWSEDYPVAQGKIDRAVREHDYAAAVAQLKKQPGVFARELFATILQFPEHDVVADFKEVVPQLPLRLIFTLGMRAESYFAGKQREVRTITGLDKIIGPNMKVFKHTEAECKEIVKKIKDLTLTSLADVYAKNPEPGVKIYIDPQLFNIPLPIADRSQGIQAFSSALPGTTFDVEGDNVRIFLHWGEGMPAQRLDLDISAKLITTTGVNIDCYYGNLAVAGAKHSGDMRAIPDKVGTAEYIELNIPELQANKVKYVVFTASNYSGGSLNVNARVGWMNSAYPMTVSDETGVAYDPSCVQHMVKVGDNAMMRTLVFGMLDVDARKIIWLELGTEDQAVFTMDVNGVTQMLERLRSKTTIGQALEILASARGMIVVPDPAEADRAYTAAWANDVPEVIATLL